jgi:hypothetical protein
MVSISVKTNFPQIGAQLKALGDDIATKAVISAINKTIAQGQTAMIRAISGEFAIKQAKVRQQLDITRARFTKKAQEASATLEAFGPRPGQRARNVIMFTAKQVVGKKKKRVRFKSARGWVTMDVPIGGGVSVLIKKGGGRKLIAGAFIANKGRTVFIRKPGSKRKISPVQTIDVPQMFNTQRINGLVRKIITERFPRIFEHEAQYFLGKFSGG